MSAFRENLGDGRIFTVFINDQPEEGWQLRSSASRRLLMRMIEEGKPLGEVVHGQMYYGIKTGLNEAFIIDNATRKRLIQSDPASEQFITPPVRGEDLRPWYQESEGRWLLCIPSGWTIKRFPQLSSRDESLAWKYFMQSYPVLATYLEPFARAGRKRQDKGQFWWELRACSYYDAFAKSKIFWADIAKYPRFSWDERGFFSNDKGFFLATTDQSLLGIPQSRACWYCISHLCAPLGERNGGIRYQHKIQYIEHIPLPVFSDEQRTFLETVSRQLTSTARRRYQVRRGMAQRVKSDLGTGQSKITDRLDEWWLLDWQGFRDEVRKSFKREIPLKERREWQALFQEQQDEMERLTAAIVKLEGELNAVVYAAYRLNEEEIALIERETKYAYGEW